jgi:phage virion morphogenesis protein
MIEIRVTDREALAALERLERLERQTSNMSGPMADVARAMANLTEDAFQSERSPFGPAWADLSAPYVERPRQKGGRGGNAHPILQLSGGLAASIDRDSGRDFAQVSAGKVYAAIHQFGGRTGRGHAVEMPARSFLPVTEDGKLSDGLHREVMEIVTEALEDAARI